MGASFRLANADEIVRKMNLYGPKMVSAVRQEWTKIGRDIAIDAKNNHRFTSHSYNLENAVSSLVSSDGMTLTIEGGRSRAQSYAERIHEGFGTWARDPFIENAFNRAVPKMGDRLEAAIGKAIGAE